MRKGHLDFSVCACVCVYLDAVRTTAPSRCSTSERTDEAMSMSQGAPSHPYIHTYVHPYIRTSYTHTHTCSMHNAEADTHSSGHEFWAANASPRHRPETRTSPLELRRCRTGKRKTRNGHRPAHVHDGQTRRQSANADVAGITWSSGSRHGWLRRLRQSSKEWPDLHRFQIPEHRSATGRGAISSGGASRREGYVGSSLDHLARGTREVVVRSESERAKYTYLPRCA